MEIQKYNHRSKEQLIERLLRLLNTEKFLHDTVANTAAQIENQFKAQFPQMTPALEEKISKKVKAWLQKIVERKAVKGLPAKIYDKYFNEQELKELVVFYASDTGQKCTNLLPNLMREVVGMMQKLIAQAIPELQSDITNLIVEERK